MIDFILEYLPVALVILFVIYKVRGSNLNETETDSDPQNGEDRPPKMHKYKNLSEMFAKLREADEKSAEPSEKVKNREPQETVKVAPDSAEPREKEGKRKERIRINTKSEAKKAFIYSEIFNKKY